MPWPLLTILLLLPTLALAVPSKQVLVGKVVRVIDEDAIVVLTEDQTEVRVRLFGIDAPEQRGSQPFWRASRDQLAKMVAGKPVTVTWDKRDRNGRILGWVLVGEGIWVNKVMVLTGYAWWYEEYAKDEDPLREAQEAAKEAKRGLWGEAMAVAPWEWRDGVRKL